MANCPDGTQQIKYKENETKHEVARNACVKSNVIVPKKEVAEKLHTVMSGLGYKKGVDYVAYVRVMPLPEPKHSDGACSCMCGCSS